MRSILTQGRVIILVTGVAVLLSIGGLASAAFTITGFGLGAGEVAEVVPLELTAGTVPKNDTVFPGGIGDVVLDVRNRNSFDVEVQSLAQDGPITTNKAGCDPAWFTYTAPPGPWLVPAGWNLTVTLTDALAMAPEAGNDCAKAKVSIPIAAEGVQFIDPNATTTTTTTAGNLIDVVLVMDESGSMASDVTVLKNSAADIVSQLATGDRDMAFGLVGFGGLDSFGDPIQRTHLVDGGAFIGAILSLNGDGNFAKPGLDALMLAFDAANTMFHRDGAKTCAVLISANNPSGDTYDEGTALAQLGAYAAQLSTITNEMGGETAYARLAQQTGGQTIQILDPLTLPADFVSLIEDCIASGA